MKKKRKKKKRKKNGGEGGWEQQVMNLSSRFGLSNLLYTFGTNLTLNLLDLIILNCSGHFKDLFCFFKFHLFTWLWFLLSVSLLGWDSFSLCILNISNLFSTDFIIDSIVLIFPVAYYAISLHLLKVKPFFLDEGINRESGP